VVRNLGRRAFVDQQAVESQERMGENDPAAQPASRPARFLSRSGVARLRGREPFLEGQ
jgi:hypothetical protein